MRVLLAVDIPNDKLREEWEEARAEDETTQSWEAWVADQATSVRQYASGWTDWADVRIASVMLPPDLVHEARFVEDHPNHGPALVCDLPDCAVDVHGDGGSSVWVWELPVYWRRDEGHYVGEGQSMWRAHAQADHGYAQEVEG